MTAARCSLGLRPLERLTWQDAGYLRRETDAQPNHFVLLALVEPAASGDVTGLPQVRTHMAARLHRVPALRRKVRRAPAGIGPMVWVDDPDFSLDRHVRPWEIAITDEAELTPALARLATRRLDPARPLWEIAVAPPLPDGRTPLAFSIHHSLMDGGLLARALADLFAPDGEEGSAPPWRPARGPTGARLVAIGVRERVRDRLRRWTGARPSAAPAAAGNVTSRATRSRLAGPVSAQRAVASLTVQLDDLRRVRQATGATVNDVFLAAVADGLGAYLTARGDIDSDGGGPLLALVPRDVRAPDEARATGNRTWSMYVPLPVGRQDPEARLTAVRAATTIAKAAERSSGAAGFRFDISVSNVRLGHGHRLAGSRLAGYGAAVPLQGENRLAVVGMSYDDGFTITFTGDGARYQDLHALAADTAAAVSRLVFACAEPPP